MSTEVVDTDCCGPEGCCAGGCCGDKCCCSMPHGKKVLFPTITLTIASILSMIVLCNCEFVKPQGYSRQNYYSAGIWGGCAFGPYNYNDPYNYQFSYERHREDSNRKVAMSFGLIACIVGVGAMIGLWPITCKPYSTTWIRIISGIVVFVFVSQLLTLTMFGTEYCNVFGCKLGWSGIMSIVTAAIWLIGAVLVLLIPKPIVGNETTPAQAAVKETVQITETIQADGTKVTEKVTTAPDGTKTIEKTIERSVVAGDGGVEKPVDDGGEHEAVHAVAVP